MTPVNGLHHVTAIAGGAQKNLTFYRDTLGQRFVKKTVNFDDPGTYHLYYGDEVGNAGTIMTFFPWEHMRPGRKGAGQVILTSFSIPSGAMDFWRGRLGAPLRQDELFGERRAVFADPDGLEFAVVEQEDDPRTPWETDEISADVAIRGFRGVTLGLRDGASTARILTEIFGYSEVGTEDGVTRYTTKHSRTAETIDLEVDAQMPLGQEGAGSVHHVAFSVPDRAAQDTVRRALVEAGHQVTPQIDRDYFYAIYTRTPGGVLFEVATEEPGFTADEAKEALGTGLKLPTQHEHLRSRIEEVLPEIS